MKIRKDCTCPLEISHDILKGKWKLVIIWQINYHEKVSLSQLQKDIKGISQKMLLQHLNELREYKIIDKKQYEGYPLKVEYYLTKNRGKKIVEALKIFQDIGKEYLEELENDSF